MITKYHIVYNHIRFGVSLAVTGFLLGLMLSAKADAHVDFIELNLGEKLEQMKYDEIDAKLDDWPQYLLDRLPYDNDTSSETCTECDPDSGWLGSSSD